MRTNATNRIANLEDYTKTTELRFRTDREFPWREIEMNNRENKINDTQGIVLTFKPRTRNRNHRTEQLLMLIGGLICLLILAVSSSFAQDDPKRGFQPGNSYSLSDIENINTTNGNVLLNIPLVTLPKGRGEVSKSISLMYNSKLYDTTVEETLDDSNQLAHQNMLKASDTGGWRYSISGNYTLDVISRFEQSEPVPCGGGDAGKNAYAMRTVMHMPDGSRKEFRPTGQSDIYDDGFYAVMASGYTVAGCGSSNLHSSSGMVYYSTDGSFTKLVVDYVSGSTGRGDQNPWTLYMSDGSKVRKDSNGIRITDRNGNYVEGLTDNFGRSITLQKNVATNEDHITMRGINNEELKWIVKWKTITFAKPYRTTGAGGGIGRGGASDQSLSMSFKVIDRITLPAQLGNLYYEFNYNTESSLGYGEISKVTMPSGATSEYEYKFDTNIFSPILLTTDFILQNSISKKTVTYLEEHDGSSNSTSDVWDYNINKTLSTITAPDGTVTTNNYGDTTYQSASQGLVYKSSDSNGNITEKIWESNRPTGTSTNTLKSINLYVKTEFTTVADASGNPSLTKIVDYTYDKNGNVTETKEYDWVAYSSISHASSGPPVVTGIPGGATLKRITTNVYYNPASTAANGYWSLGSPAKRNAIKSTTVKNASGTPASHSEFFYDNAATTGNVTQVKVWDSSKGAYSNPLSGSNSISTTTTYDSYGNPLIATDANGVQSKLTYGAVGGYSGLYPTQTETAYGTSVERTSTAQYDFYTGAVTQSTDVDNNISSATEYDALGRSTKSIAAVGTSNEVWTETEYGDVSRRIVTRADLETKGDGKIVSIRHFDQLGRLRLARSLENASTEDPYNESHGIKVQTRYETTNPYTYAVTSNPYRATVSSGAGGEEAMGWTRSKAWNTGRRSEAETFSGASLPAPWGSNSSSTGKVISESDADASTVTDQAGKKRRSLTNALGQLLRIDEPNATGNLGTKTSPVQATSYLYDTSGNMVEVTQGVQKRYFGYDSLGRLLRVRQPEQQVNSALDFSVSGTSNTQWTAGFTYDGNGNTLTARDAKNVVITSSYDQLNRSKVVSYSDGTPTVTSTYDSSSTPFSKGRLTKISNSVSNAETTAFDTMGRVLTSRQITDGQTYSSSYQYNLSGKLIQETYPSGRVITNSFDAKGDLLQIDGQMGSVNNNYVGNINYTASGHIGKLKLGNNLWEAAKLNSRFQIIELGLGTNVTSLNLWKLNFEHGELSANGTVDQTKNTGNVAKQTISFSGLAQPFVQTYKFDSLDRLIEAKEMSGSSQNWKQTFGYDRYNNRTTFTQVIGSTNLPINSNTKPAIDVSNNRFTAGQGYTYDLAGNLISDPDGKQYVFNGDNKQTQVKDGQNNIIGTYHYDGRGKRIKKVTAAETTTFVYSGEELVAEYSTIAPPAQAETKYVATDSLGSIRVISDQNGNIVSRRDFMPFGEELYAGTPNRTTTHKYSTSGDNVRQKFTGYERDKETGLDFAEARYYKYNHGRFTAVDPLLSSGKSGDPQTFNRYTYVMNNPLTFTDPTGLQAGSKGKADIYVETRVKKLGFFGKIKSAIKTTAAALYRAVVGESNPYQEEDISNRNRKRSGMSKQLGNAVNNRAKGNQKLTDAAKSIDPTGVVNLTEKTVKNSVGQASNREVAGAYGDVAVNVASMLPVGGIIAKGGQKVVGFTAHGLKRVAGGANRKGVAIDAVIDSLENPLKVGKVIVDKLGRKSQRYIGRNGSTVVNPDTGKIVSVNPTSTKLRERLLRKLEEEQD